MSTDKGEPTGEKEPDLVEEQPSAETVVAPEQVGQFGKQFFEFPETRVVTEFSKPVSLLPGRQRHPHLEGQGWSYGK